MRIKNIPLSFDVGNESIFDRQGRYRTEEKKCSDVIVKALFDDLMKHLW